MAHEGQFKPGGPNPGAFKPGQSGNPGGKPKGVLRQIRELHGNDAVKIVGELVKMALDENLDPKHRIAASKEALDRIIGKPQQKVDLSGDLNVGKRVDLRNLSDEELRILAKMDDSDAGDGRIH